MTLLWGYFSNFFKRQTLEKGTWRFEYLKLLWDYFFNFFFRRQAWKKGVCRFQIALGLLKKKSQEANLEKGSLQIWDLFWDFLIFLKDASLKKGSLQIWDCFGTIFFGGNPWKRESGDLRLLWDFFFWEAILWKRELFFNKMKKNWKYVFNIFFGIC